MAQKPTMWCAACNQYQICPEIPSDKPYIEPFIVPPTNLGPKRNFYNKKHPDIHWFRRLRRCDVCGAIFETAELEDSFVDELANLRDKLESANKQITELKMARE